MVKHITRQAYIGLGSNLGDRLDYLRQALDKLSREKKISLKTISPVYETEPIGGPHQGPFLNACAALVTDLTPVLLLRTMLRIEEQLGRVRNEIWGPRTIDLDLLVYEGVSMNTPLLQLPHPRLTERDFVLIPLHDIAPQLILNRAGDTTSDLILARPHPGGISRYAHGFPGPSSGRCIFS